MASCPPAAPRAARRASRRCSTWPDIPANSALFLRTAEEARRHPRGSFRLTICRDCGFLFNADFEPELPEYSDRNLESQLSSQEFRLFANDLARGWIERHHLRERHVLEIGAGLHAGFLRLFCELSEGTGTAFDPVTVLQGTEQIRVVPELFDEHALDEPADAVICRHTLEHIADVHGFLRTLRRWGERHPRAVYLFELPDVERVLTEGAFWDLYYEHCSYFTADTLAATFERHGFDPRCELAFGGQYLILEARRAAARAPAPRHVDTGALADLAHGFARRFRTTAARSRERLEELAADGTVLLWQAGAKAIALMSVLGAGGEIEALVDVNPAKRGLFAVGSGHRVIGPQDAAGLSPAHVIVMNPVYSTEVERMLDECGVHARVHTADALASQPHTIRRRHDGERAS